MKKKYIYKNIIFFIILSVFSITINNHYGNIGVFPIDTFAFFDTGYNIILGKHPFKDFWVTTGPLVDYLQALFFTLFGLGWSSYVIHASIFNFLITISIYLTLVKFELKPLYAFSLLFISSNFVLSSSRNSICLSTFIYFFSCFFNDFFSSFKNQ